MQATTNVPKIRYNIKETKEEIAKLETLAEELTVVRDAIYKSGERDLLPLAQEITDGTPFAMGFSSPLRERITFISAMDRTLTKEQKTFLMKWRSIGQRLSLVAISERIGALKIQLESMTAILPTTAEEATSKDQLATLIDEYERSSNAFYGFYVTLEETLNTLEAEMAAAVKSKSDARTAALNIRTLQSKSGLPVDSKYFQYAAVNLKLSNTLEGQNVERRLRERLQRFLRMVSAGDPRDVE